MTDTTTAAPVTLDTRPEVPLDELIEFMRKQASASNNHPNFKGMAVKQTAILARLVSLRDAENATRYAAAPVTMEETKPYVGDDSRVNIKVNGVWFWVPKAILASLLELQRIRTAERPEPVATVVYSNWNGVNIETLARAPHFPVGTKLYGPELLDYVDRMTAERDRLAQYHGGHMPDCAGMDTVNMTCGCGYLDGEAYRSIIARAEAAESALAKVRVLMQKPTMKMCNAGSEAAGIYSMEAQHAWEAMSAQLLRDLASDATEGSE